MNFCIKTADEYGNVSNLEQGTLTQSVETWIDFSNTLGRLGLNLRENHSIIITCKENTITLDKKSEVIVGQTIYPYKDAIKAMCEEIKMFGSVSVQVISPILTRIGI